MSTSCAPTPGSTMDGVCACCEKRGRFHQCGGCKLALYCSIDCQRKHWSMHRGALCAALGRLARDKAILLEVEAYVSRMLGKPTVLRFGLVQKLHTRYNITKEQSMYTTRVEELCDACTVESIMFLDCALFVVMFAAMKAGYKKGEEITFSYRLVSKDNYLAAVVLKTGLPMNVVQEKYEEARSLGSDFGKPGDAVAVISNMSIEGRPLRAQYPHAVQWVTLVPGGKGMYVGHVGVYGVLLGTLAMFGDLVCADHKSLLLSKKYAAIAAASHTPGKEVIPIYKM
jgi:hypothetical protein